MDLLTELLSSHVRAEIFRLLFQHSEVALHLRDIQRRSGLAIGTIQKEIARLKRLDLIQREKDGNRIYYSANKSHPLYNNICDLVEKTSGILEKLRELFVSIQNIECAFIFGSFAKGTERAQSDIDLIVIGDTSLRILSEKLKNLTNKIEREINPHVYSRQTWNQKTKKKDHFIKSILSEDKVFIVGDENVLK